MRLAGDPGAERPEPRHRGGVDLWQPAGERGLDLAVGLELQPAVFARVEVGADLGGEVVVEVAVELALEHSRDGAAVDLGFVTAPPAPSDHVGRPFR